MVVFYRLRAKWETGRAGLVTLDRYYSGTQNLQQLGLAVPPQLQRFTTLVNWPRVVVDSIEERLDVEGFRYPGEERADADLWQVWQENDLDEESQQAHLDALVHGRSFVSVSAGIEEGDSPRIVVESATEMVTIEDPATRETIVAAKFWEQDKKQYATFWQPNATIWLTLRNGQWKEERRDVHMLGAVPVVPIVNRPRTGRRDGVSEMADVIGLTDAAARTLTNLQLAQETHAVPQRAVLGASKADFVDSKGKQLPVWEAYFSAVWAISNPSASTAQFAASDLRNFHETVNHYAHQVSAVSGLPLRFFGQNTANPPSADGIRADETRLVKRCERKQRTFSGGWEKVMRIAERIRTGEWNRDLRRLETIWRDPSTPTVAAVADAVVKQHQTGILPVEMAWEELGWSEAKIARARRLQAEQLTDPLLNRLFPAADAE